MASPWGASARLAGIRVRRPAPEFRPSCSGAFVWCLKPPRAPLSGYGGQ